MKAFLRLFAATLAMMAGPVSSWVLILLSFFLALQYFGLVQAFITMALVVSLVIAALVHWSEQDSFPFR